MENPDFDFIADANGHFLSVCNAGPVTHDHSFTFPAPLSLHLY
jgi:hypothetical protein